MEAALSDIVLLGTDEQVEGVLGIVYACFSGTVLGGLGILLNVESTPPADLERAKAESIPLATSLGVAIDKFFALLPA